MSQTQMKLSFIGDNHLEGVERDSSFAVEQGFDGIEYNFWGEFRTLTLDTVKQMAAVHKKHGTKASMLGSWGFNHMARNLEERAEAHKLLDRQIEFAQELRADWIVTSCGEIHGEPVGRQAAEFASTFEPFFAKIQKAGLKIAFYAVHGNSFLDSIEAMERAWEVVPELKLKYDPANWRSHGNDYLEIARRYAHKIGYVHIKDQIAMNGRSISEPPAGMGEIEFPKILTFLYQANYDGYLSIEPHGHTWGQGEMRRKLLLISKRYLEPMLV
jgi:sugar phosphate isomerase/epimerase